MMQDPEMDFLNQLFRAELTRFKNADEATRRQVVRVIVQAGGLDWLTELVSSDKDPQIRAYGDIAQEYRKGE